jgi:hypothetical protein
LIQEINSALAIDLPVNIDLEEMKKLLAVHINHLIQHDFQKLIFILYRVDVNEEKLKLLLQENTGEDAGRLIATLLIDRQLQKISTRREYRSRANEENAEDKW